MTQPNGPGLQTASLEESRGPIQIAGLEESRGGADPFAQVPQPVPGAPGAGGIDWAAIQGAEAGQIEERASRREREAAEQADLEARHGAGGTLGTQLARGALSALLAPGALLGAASETLGSVAGTKALEDFGRDLGRASTGRSAIEVLGAAFGEGEATDAADRARIAVDEQERAWPLLSTLAQIGGGLAAGVATGGLAAGAAGLTTKTLAAVGAVEGAGAGAQAAYEADAPLADVWTSAAIGGVMGGALAAGVSAGSRAIGKQLGKRANMQEAFSGEQSILGDFAENRAAKAVGMRGPEFRRLGKKRALQIGADVLDTHLDDGTPVIPKNVLEAARIDQGELTERLAQATGETGQKLGTLRQRVSAFIDESSPDLRPNVSALSARIEQEILAPLDNVASPGAASQAREARRYLQSLAARGDELSLEELFQQRLAIDRFDAKFNAKAPEVMNDVRRVMEEHIEATVAEGARRAGIESDYVHLKRMFGSLKEASTASAKASGTDLGNRWMSLSDNMVGAATFVGDLASGGGLSVIKGLGVGVAHKILREQGSIAQAALLNRFRRTAATIAADVAGGKEAQGVLTQLTRYRNFLADAAEQAGPNPAARVVAENTAQEVATEELARIAGKFAPEAWQTASRAPSPLARVFYRSQILDTVSNDLAATVPRSVAMRPTLDFDLDPQRLARFVKDAKGPEAIGAVQAQVREIAESAPADMALDAVLDGLNTADTSEAMTIGHRVARELMASGDTVNARALMTTLGDDAFGQAGRFYRKLIPTPDEMLEGLSDPKQLRDTLRTLELRGQLSQQISAEHKATLDAYMARQKLTGDITPVEIKKQMRAIEKLWELGEEHVTLDGARLGRIVEKLDQMIEQKVSSKVPRGSPEQQVMGSMQEALEPVTQAAKRKPVKAKPSRIGPAAAAGAAIGAAEFARLTAKERLEAYEDRLDRVTRAVVQPDAEIRTAAVSQAPHGLRTTLMSTTDQKMAQLQRDMPKPATSLRGKATDSLSSDDIRKGLAYYSATVDPLSVFRDWANGAVDPDKVAYAWKQYPGLQRAAQMGVLDILQSQLTGEELDAIPDGMITQLDFLLGFNGGLQTTVEYSFSERFGGIGEALKQQSATPAPPSRPLKLPGSKPTMTQRIAGAA